MSPKKRALKTTRKKPEATWHIWGGCDVVSIGTRPSGKPHAVMLVIEYTVMGSEKEARKVVAMNGGGTMTLRTEGRTLKKIDVPGASAHPPIVQRRRDGQIRTDACAVERAKAAPGVSAPTIEVKDAGDGIDWRVLVNGYGIAMWSDTDGRGTGVKTYGAKTYAEEVARVLRLALGVGGTTGRPSNYADDRRAVSVDPVKRPTRQRGDPFRAPVTHMTVLQLRAERRSLDRDLAASNDGDGRGGSPLEWMMERMGEIEREIRRRVAGVPAVDPVRAAMKNAEPGAKPLTKAQRAMRKQGIAYVKAGRTFKTPVAHMTTLQLSAELRSLETKWDAFAARDDEGHGGSPGEWMVERMDEIETEIRRRRGAARKREP